jgi:hypothetical protein
MEFVDIEVLVRGHFFRASGTCPMDFIDESFDHSLGVEKVKFWTPARDPLKIKFDEVDFYEDDADPVLLTQELLVDIKKAVHAKLLKAYEGS